MQRDRRPSRVEPFRPFAPESRRRLLLRIAIAPFLWLVALLIAAIVLSRTRAKSDLSNVRRPVP
jgi:hypothetical protein